MSERSQPRRVGLQNVCIFLERNGDWGVYPCFDSADSLARVRMLRAVSCRVHSVTLAWPTFYRKDSLASGESHGIRFRDSAQKTKDPADAEHRPSARESVGLGRLCLHADIADASDDQITYFRCAIPVPAIINSPSHQVTCSRFRSVPY